jgi:hypothetical protein
MRPYGVCERVINEYGAVIGMRIGMKPEIIVENLPQ